MQTAYRLPNFCRYNGWAKKRWLPYLATSAGFEQYEKATQSAISCFLKRGDL